MVSYSLFNYGQHENKVDKFLSWGSHLHEIFLMLAFLPNISSECKTIRTSWGLHFTQPFSLHLVCYDHINLVNYWCFQNKNIPLPPAAWIFEEVKFWDNLGGFCWAVPCAYFRIFQYRKLSEANLLLLWQIWGEETQGISTRNPSKKKYLLGTYI